MTAFSLRRHASRFPAASTSKEKGMQFDKRAWLDRIKRMFAGLRPAARPDRVSAAVRRHRHAIQRDAGHARPGGRPDAQHHADVRADVGARQCAAHHADALRGPALYIRDRVTDCGGDVRPHAQGREALDQRRRGDPAVGDSEDRHTADARLVLPAPRRRDALVRLSGRLPDPDRAGRFDRQAA